MKTIDAIQSRKSVREYKDMSLSSEDKDIVISLCDNVVSLFDDTKVKFEFLDNGKDIAQKLDGTVGYSGVMIKAPHYLLITANQTEHTYQSSGYAGEYIVLELVKNGISSCWIDGVAKSDEIKSLLEISTSDIVVSLIALGYAQYDSRDSKVYKKDTQKSTSYLSLSGYADIDARGKEDIISSRMSIDKISYLKKWGNPVDADELEKRGYDKAFYYMRLAPSWGNRQPWRFILDGLKIILVIENGRFTDDRAEKLDAGIAMQYFELSMHASGLTGKWIKEKVVDFEKYEIPDNYFIAGQYTF